MSLRNFKQKTLSDSPGLAVPPERTQVRPEFGGELRRRVVSDFAVQRWYSAPDTFAASKRATRLSIRKLVPRTAWRNILPFNRVVIRR